MRWRVSKKLVAAIVAVTLASLIYFTGVTRNPPGFYIDESSIAYNAYTISQTARDEHGNRLPLFFRGFGEYKNPTYIYLLAALFRVFGPGILIARLFSALLGLAAAATLGVVAVRISARQTVGAAVAVQALLTPWLFENSRVVFEVALYPLALALFLLALARSAPKPRWSWADSTLIALTLALLTYSYTIGRLLAPLLALGLALFINRLRRRGVLQAWFVYLLTLVPLFIFQRRHPGALAARFGGLTYITPGSTVAEDVRQFAGHYLSNFSLWRILITGETNLRDHVPIMGSVLLPTIILAAMGLWFIARSRHENPWWRFIVYGLLVSAVPASLTVTEFPALRLIAVPVFLLMLTVPALMWLTQSSEASTAIREESLSTTYKRSLLAAFIGLTLAQGIFFQWRFHRGTPQRGYLFDSHYPQVFDAASAQGKLPIYLRERAGAAGYIQAYWYGTLRGMNAPQILRQSSDQTLPSEAVVISTEEDCSDCRLIVRSINYNVYITRPQGSTAIATPLPENALRAHISAAGGDILLRAGQEAKIRVTVENAGSATWPAFGSSDGRYAVVLRNVWRDAATNALISDADRAARLPRDLPAGSRAELDLPITAPATPGNYLLMIDLVQNQTPWFVRPANRDIYIEEQQLIQRQVTWFHQHGSEPLRLKTLVE
jgi:4-amino-4-deoxy-L-arabinose transferase-like glycosyltransferase